VPAGTGHGRVRELPGLCCSLLPSRAGASLFFRIPGLFTALWDSYGEGGLASCTHHSQLGTPARPAAPQHSFLRATGFAQAGDRCRALFLPWNAQCPRLPSTGAFGVPTAAGCHYHGAAGPGDRHCCCGPSAALGASLWENCFLFSLRAMQTFG